MNNTNTAATLQFGASVTLAEFAQAIATVGRDVTLIGQGEPGIGKSATLGMLAKQHPGYATAYIDCTLLDLGDFALPYTEVAGEMKITRFAPNARFGLHQNQPVIVMLDEIGKAMKSVKNVLLTLMLEHRIGDHQLPEGSIVFGTTNLTSDGVGDMLEAHARNRVCCVKVRKPDADEWIEWALEHGVEAAVIAWVKQFPHALASYTDDDSAENPYIFNPRKAGVAAVVTPRSLEKASHIARQRGVLGDSLTTALLAGTVGEAAARDMGAFFAVADELPTWERIITAPTTTKVPDNAMACCILILGAVARVTRETMPAWMTYVRGMELEWQALFASSAMKSASKQPVCISSKEFTTWALENSWAY